MALAKRNPKKLAICNMKGGVGKTACAVNLASALAIKKKKVLLVDCDYQGNSSDYLNLKVTAITNNMTLFDGIKNEKPIEDCIISTNFSRLDIIASSLELSKWEKQGYKHHKIMSWFDTKIITKTYDYIIFDMRPQLGNLFDNVMAYVDWYLVPLFAEPDALSGLKIIFSELKEIQDAYNRELKCAGLLITKFNNKNTTHKEFNGVIDSICKEYEIPLIGTIPQSDALAGSVNKFTPLPHYMEGRKKLPIRDSFLSLADFMIKNLIHKKGRIPIIPNISDDKVMETIQTLSGEEEAYFE